MRVDLSRLFNSFSRRTGPQIEPKSVLSPEFRNRVIFLCQDHFYGPTFWEQIHRNLQYFHGRQSLSRGGGRNRLDDIGQFLFECSDDHFLDFVEMIFRHWEPGLNSQQLVTSVNGFLEIDNLPYAVTDFVWQSTGDTHYRSMELVEYPRVIRRENEVIHSTAIQPALEFLATPGFTSANQEFLGALSHYRKGEYSDCLTKCGSSFESVMKVICDRRGWSYNQTDTASTLLDIVFPHTTLDPFFKQPIFLVATIRNRLSGSHGAGTQQRNVPAHVANYALTATASVILLLVAETNP